MAQCSEWGAVGEERIIDGMTLPTIIALIAVVGAALLHLFIFWLEAFAWEGPTARKIFGGTAEEARAHAFYAFNQGFYNLFLAIGAAIGAVLVAVSRGVGTIGTVGTTLALFSTASMLCAALVLFAASPAHRSAAVKQGALPLIGVILLIWTLIA